MSAQRAVEAARRRAVMKARMATRRGYRPGGSHGERRELMRRSAHQGRAASSSISRTSCHPRPSGSRSASRITPTRLNPTFS